MMYTRSLSFLVHKLRIDKEFRGILLTYYVSSKNLINAYIFSTNYNASMRNDLDF